MVGGDGWLGEQPTSALSGELKFSRIILSFLIEGILLRTYQIIIANLITLTARG